MNMGGRSEKVENDHPEELERAPPLQEQGGDDIKKRKREQVTSPCPPADAGSRHGPLTLFKGVISGRATAGKLAQYAEQHGLRPWTQDTGCDWDSPCLFKRGLYDPHTHLVNEAVYVKSGTITVTNVKSNTKLVANTGDIVKIPTGPNSEHVESTETHTAYGVLFEYD